MHNKKEMAKNTNYKKLSKQPPFPLARLTVAFANALGAWTGPVSNVTALPSCGQAEYR